MHKIIRSSLAAVLLLALGACFHAELNGPVAGATVVITELRSGAVAQDGLTSLDVAGGIAAFNPDGWDGLGDLGQLVSLGNFFVDKNNFVKSRLYLVSVIGGQDMDGNADGVVNNKGKKVAGSLHSIMKGSHLQKGGFVVSPVTEALYQSVKDDVPNLTDSAVMSRLGKNTRLILNNVDDAGKVNYNDALAWTEINHIGKYKLDFSAIEDLADAITAGEDESSIAQLSALVMGEEPAIDAQQFFADNVAMPVVQSKCINCHTSTGIAPSQGARLVLVTNSNSNHLSINHEAFIELGDALGSTDLSDHVTQKASGQLGHGGGKQLSNGTQDFLNLEAYLNLIE
ncbi:MAG: hypothetical protein V7709_10375 [Halioglobus sp.]